MCKGIHNESGSGVSTVIAVVSRCALQFLIHSNIPTKQFNIKAQESKNNNENTSEIKHITMN